MRTTSKVLGLALLLGSVFGCAPPRPVVRIPPRVDLSQHETIGVITFRSSADRDLAALATDRFTESARRDQGLVRMIDLGRLGKGDLDAQSYRDIGVQHGVQTLFVGELTLSKRRPSVHFDGSLKSGSVAAVVEGTLAVRLIETSTGASIWSGSGRASDSLGQLSVQGGGGVAVGGDDPEVVYDRLVEHLVEQATNDFHAHWQ